MTDCFVDISENAFASKQIFLPAFRDDIRDLNFIFDCSELAKTFDTRVHFRYNFRQLLRVHEPQSVGG